MGVLVLYPIVSRNYGSWLSQPGGSALPKRNVAALLFNGGMLR